MEDQVGSFSSRGIRSVKAGSRLDHETTQLIINGEYQLVFISPEALLSKKQWRKMLLCREIWWLWLLMKHIVLEIGMLQL